jgi:uncharacterized membrane protein (UPF0136 family)
MDSTTIAALGYGILTIVGGILGYAKARSQTSLVSGLVSGILLIVSGVAHQQGSSWGEELAIIITLSLIVIFAIRFIKTSKFMPAGLMVVAGILALGAMVLG